MTGSESRPAGTAEPAASELARALSGAAEAVRGIIQEAEHRAAEIRADAVAEADIRLARGRRQAEELVATRSRHLAEMARTLADSLERLEALSAEARRELADAAEQLVEIGSPAARQPGEQAPPWPSVDVHESLVRPRFAAPGGDADGAAGDHAGPRVSVDESEATEEAVLRATQLVVSGRDHSEIEGILREEFGMTAPGGIIDEIVGPTAAIPGKC